MPRSMRSGGKMMKKVFLFALACLFASSLSAATVRNFTVEFDEDGGTKTITCYKYNNIAEYEYKYSSTGVYSQNWIENVEVNGYAEGYVGYHSLIYTGGIRYAGIVMVITAVDGTALQLRVKCAKNTGAARSFTGQLNRWDTLTIKQSAARNATLQILGPDSVESGADALYSAEVCSSSSTSGISTQKVSPTWSLAEGSSYATLVSLITPEGCADFIAGDVTVDRTVKIKATYSGLTAYKTVVVKAKSSPPPAPSITISTYGDNANSSYIKVTWSSVSDATAYDIYRSTSTTRPSTPLKTSVTSPYYDYKSSGLTAGTRYYYWVSARNSSGTSYSNSDWGNLVDEPPSAPSVSNVGFNPNGGTLSGGNFGAKNGTAQTATLTLTYGKSVYNAGMRATRTEPGYAFNGFWTAASGGSQIYDANGKFVPNSLCWTASGTWKHTGNAMLYAQWHTHTVKFNPNGGTLSGGNFGAKNGTSQVATLQVTCGAGSYSAGMRATQNGAAFNGWWTATSGGSQIYDANGKFVPGCRCWTADGKWQHHCNAVLYARWATSKYSSVTFNPNGGCLYGGNFGLANGTSDPVTIMIAFGSGANNSGMRATRGGYMFMGWWTADSGGSQIYDASGRYKPDSRCWTSDGLWQHYGSAALYARWLPITLDGNADWVLQADGSWISGMITHGQYTTLQTAVNGSGTLTFHWKVSCEGDDEREWDYLEWLVDDVRQGKIGGVHEGWSVVSLKIDGTGTHTIQWRYCKDSNDSAGKDCGWIRNVWWSGSVQ